VVDTGTVRMQEDEPSQEQDVDDSGADRSRPGDPAAGTSIDPVAPQAADGKPHVVVGIGASAGGLEALVELIQHVPRDHMTFIVLQHLSPDHESMLPQLLGRSSKLEVIAATDGAVLQANRIYVNPPNADLAVLNGVIQLITPSPPGPRLPIDFLFRSLAEDCGHRAIGIILSGTGSDGTFGLQAIKSAGGMTFVQEPSSAKYDGMPRSALASGAADFCLTLPAIGEELERIAHAPRRKPPPDARQPARSEDQFTKLFVLIRSEFGTDLTHYKHATIERRVERRMALHRIERLDDYVRFVRGRRDELQALYKDLLITVTRFFRDPEVFETLKDHIIEKLLEHKDANTPVRVWVPACSTGEEAYSLAICLLEFCETRRKDARIQIFGTDLDEECIEVARRGIYPANIALDVSPDRLNRFFVRKGDEYHVSRRVRDLLVFSRQNILKDAPFSRIDLVSCRNLLIYLQPASQKRVLRILHYALNAAGHLLLGASETIGDAPELFSIVDRKHKVYRKKHAAAPAGLDVTFGVPHTTNEPPAGAAVRSATNVQGLVDRKVLELYGPPGVVLNEDLEILQFRGHTGAFLDPAQGAASLNVLKIVRFELHIALKRSLEEAARSQQRVTTEVSYMLEGEQTAVSLDVVPIHDPNSKVRYLLVAFELVAPPRPPEGGPGASDQPSSALAARVGELEAELALTKDYLQETIEERESTLEELKSANEELQSSNEELQSTNEELETSKEELQSTNEELTTVNDELQSRMTELSQTNDDLHNVLSGVDNAVVIVGLDLRIRRYTTAAERLFNLVPADVGRSVGFLDPFLASGPLERKLSQVIESLASVEEDVLASNHRWYTMRLTPYKTLDHAIRGALVTLVDIDVRKRAAEVTQDVATYASRFLAAIGNPLLIIDRRLRVIWCNDRFMEEFQLTRDETIGNHVALLGARRLDQPPVLERIESCFATSTIFRDVAVQARSGERPGGKLRVSGSLIPASGDTALMLLSFEVSRVGAEAP
jgi:two-component system CheB/CheR fusion protein